MSTCIPFYSADAVHAALAWPALIDALREAFLAGASVPLRHSHTVRDDEGARLLLMPAWRAGEALTLRRTAAASALASRYLSRPESATLLVVGTGQLAPYMAEAHCAVRPLRRVFVWGRSPARAQALAAQLAQRGLPAEPVRELARALAESDLVTCATT